jgi:hypothetical protein
MQLFYFIVTDGETEKLEIFSEGTPGIDLENIGKQS